LDPFATGLLLLCVGSFTRTAEYFHALPKRYAATMRLGQQRDTDDLTGKVIEDSEAWRDLDEHAVVSALEAKVGPGEQVPSTFSAKKVDGVRAYAEARAGRAVELAPVPVVIHKARVTGLALPHVEFEVEVSTGTYVRALARDLGRDLNCGGYLTALRRTGIGPFEVAEACELAVLERGGTVPLPAWRDAGPALSWLPRRDLEPEEVEALEHGRSIAIGSVTAPPGPGRVDGPIGLLRGDRLVAVGRIEDGRLRPQKVFPAC